MELILQRGGEAFRWFSSLWRTVVAAAGEQGWEPPGDLCLDRDTRLREMMRLMNGRLDAAAAKGLTKAFRIALIGPTLPTGVATERESVQEWHGDIWDFMRGGAFAASRRVVLGNSHSDDADFEIDARGWCLLQRLAHDQNGWLPAEGEIPGVPPHWFAPDLITAWERRHGRVGSAAREDLDVRMDYDDLNGPPGLDYAMLGGPTALTCADAIEAAMPDCPVEDALAAHVQDGREPPDTVPARAIEWFSGPRRLAAERFVRILRGANRPQLVC